MIPDFKPQAIELAATAFGVSPKHITAAPLFCGDGIDGACSKGDCEIVEAVGLGEIALRQAYHDGAASVAKEIAERMCPLCAGTALTSGVYTIVSIEGEVVAFKRRTSLPSAGRTAEWTDWMHTLEVADPPLGHPNPWTQTCHAQSVWQGLHELLKGSP